MPGLGVNIDHVATVRQARRTVEPDPVWAAVQAELGGADGITFHLREDRRHISDRDAQLLCQVVQVQAQHGDAPDRGDRRRSPWRSSPARPRWCRRHRQEITTEGGLDVVANMPRVREVTQRLQDAGIIVSAFIDPDPTQIAGRPRSAATRSSCTPANTPTPGSADERGASTLTALAQRRP